MKPTNNLIVPKILSLWWFPILVGTMLVIGSVTVLVPQGMNLMDTIQRLKQTQGELVKAEKKLEQVSQFDITSINKNTQLVDAALPAHKPYFELLTSLQQLAGTTGVSLGDFDLNPGSLATQSSQKKSTNDSTVSLGTEIEVSGNVDQVKQFVESLQQLLPVIAVNEISISHKPSSDTYQASLGVTVFYSEGNKTVNTASIEPLPVLSTETQETLTTLAQYTTMTTSGEEVGSSPVDYNRGDLFSF